MDKDAFYFPHFSNARLDRKIKRVRKELGLEGYGIYFMILETLRDQENFNYPLKDIDLLADEFGTSEQKIRTVISNYDLFRITDDEHFFSPKLLVFLQPYLEGKEKRRIGGIKGNLIRYKHITKEEAKDLNDAQILDIHNSITFKSAFNSLPIAKDSLTEQDTDRFGSQIQYNSTQLNEIQYNEIQQNTYKEKNTKKENNYNKPNYENYKPPVIDQEPVTNVVMIPKNISQELHSKFVEFMEYKKLIGSPIKTSRPFTDLISSIGKSYSNEDHLIQCLNVTMAKEWKHPRPEYVDYRPVTNTKTVSNRADIEEYPDDYIPIGSLTEELAKKVKT